MKKRMHKLCTILTASALLAMSVTVYAAEGDNTEAGFQPAEEGTVQSADTEQTQETASEQTEEKDPEENGLDSFIYIREKEDKTTGKAKVKKVTRSMQIRCRNWQRLFFNFQMKSLRQRH